MTTKQVPTYTVEKYVREETNDYGRAGEIEWHVMCQGAYGNDCVEVWPLRRMAKAHADRCNATLAAESI